MKPGSPAEPVGLLVAAIRRGVRQLVERRIDGTGLSSVQFWVLVGVAERPGRPQAELAARLRRDEATTCRVVRSLRDRGYLAAVRPADDQRCLLLNLTPAGGAVARRLLPIAREVRTAVEAPMTDAEREIVRAALQKVVASLRPPPPAPRPPPPAPPRAGLRRASRRS